jgi:hypothetical protein
MTTSANSIAPKLADWFAFVPDWEGVTCCSSADWHSIESNSDYVNMQI